MKNDILKSSLKSSLTTSIYVIKVVIPLYIIVDVLNYLDLLAKITFLFEPFTSFIGLPKEASLSIAGGIFFNIYTAIAFAAPIGLNGYEWTILGLFLGICHSLLIETAIMSKIGIKPIYSIGLRIIVAFVSAFVIKLFPATFFNNEIYADESSKKIFSTFYEMILNSLSNASILTLKIILLMTIIIFFMGWLRSRAIIKKYQTKLNIFFPLLIGLILGITYGAGILINEVKDNNLTKNEIFFIATFLLIAHAIIEDGLLFVIFGANYWILTITRTVMAIIFAIIALRIYSYLSPSIKEKLL